MSTVLKIAPATNASIGSRGEKARFYKVERTMIRCTYLLNYRVSHSEMNDSKWL